MADVAVLCYHAVSPSWPAALSVTPAALERQLSLLIRRGWQPATFTQAVLDPPWSRTLAVTFDDAFASVRTLAEPVLSSLGLPATVFVPTTPVSQEAPLGWPGVAHWQDTQHAHELTAMTWNDLGELAERGWEIGSHTRSHRRLTQLGDEALSVELRTSLEECSAAIGLPCRSIAYPYGDVDERVAQRAREAGYVCGAALSSGLRKLGPHRWPRIGVFHVDSVRRFELKTASIMRHLRASPLWLKTT